MGTHTDTMQSPLVSLSEASASPCVASNRRLCGALRSIVPPLPALRAFADGFVGSLAGGLVYCMILAYFSSQDLQIAGMRVLALSLTFGGFEVWRVSRQRTMKSAGKCLLWTLTVSLLVFLALGSYFSSAPTRDSRQDSPPHLLPVRLDPIA